MKNKVLKITLLACAALAMASCQQVEKLEPIEAASSYVYNLYKGDQTKAAAEVISTNLERVVAVAVDGEQYTVEWSVNNDKVTIEAGTKTKTSGSKTITYDIVTIKPDFQSVDAYEFTLTAKVTAPDGTYSFENFHYAVEAYEVPGWASYKQSSPVADTPFYFGFYQATRGEMCFFTGEMNGSYLNTSSNPKDAVAMYLEAVDGGWRQYFLQNGVKEYVEVYDSTGAGKNAVQITETPTNYGVWNDEVGQLRWTIGTSEYYMGTYSSYNTVSSSKVTYIDGDNRAKVDISQFPAYNLGTGVASVYGDVVTELDETTTFKAGFYQRKLDKFCWVDGTMNGSYMSTTQDAASAVEFHAEKADGGWRIYYVDADGAKQYAEVYDSTGAGKNAVHFTTTPTNVGVWYEELNQLRWTIGESVYYMGTYSSYNTVSSSKVSYIDGDNRPNVDVSQHIIRFYK